MPEIIPNNPNLEKEIEVLEKRLAEKKAALSDQKEPLREREVVREVVRERVAEQMAVSVSSQAGSKVKAKDAKPIVLPGKISPAALKKASSEKQIDILLGVAFSDSIANAVSLAQKLESPYALDALHDVLVDKFYEELIRRGKIN